jgi:hypothetical protein
MPDRMVVRVTPSRALSGVQGYSPDLDTYHVTEYSDPWATPRMCVGSLLAAYL